MKQSELLFKIGSELTLELIINIYSYCEKVEHTSISVAGLKDDNE